MVGGHAGLPAGALAGAVLFLLGVTEPFSALAQVPAPAEPGRVEKQFEPPPSAPPVAPPLAVPAMPEAPIAAPSGLSFELKDVVVSGATVYTPAELRKAYQSFLDKTITVEALAQLENAVTLKYRRDGYILARAVVDPQSIDPAAGVVHLTVYEGYIDKVHYDPLDYEVGAKGHLIRAILDKIAHACRPGDQPTADHPCPLHRDVLERYLLLANDLPGVKASAVILPSADAAGGADLFVTITEKPIEADATIDDRGSTYVGPDRAQAFTAFNNILGVYDRTELRYAQSVPFNELWLVNAVEEVPLTPEGLRLAIDYTHSRSKPGDLLRPQDLLTIGNSGGFTVSYPWLRTRAQNFTVHFGFELRDAVTQTQDTPLDTDRTRVATFGGTYDLADTLLGVNLVDLSVNQGVPLFGASRQASLTVSHVGAAPDFTKLNGEISRLQQLYPQFNLLLAGTGQYSYSKLLASEQIGYGGEQYGRGYDPSEILGDRGIAGKTELQYTPTWAPGLFGAQGIRGLQFYTFYDIGRLWTDPGPSTHLSGASAGGGVRYTITDYLAGYLEVAKPLTRAVQALAAKGETGKGPRIFFSVALKY